MGKVAEQVQFFRQLRQEDMTCPVATLLGESCIHCPIEDSVLDVRQNPGATSYCMGEPLSPFSYTRCPTWRAQRELEWARSRDRLGDVGIPGPGLFSDGGEEA